MARGRITDFLFCLIDRIYFFYTFHTFYVSLGWIFQYHVQTSVSLVLNSNKSKQYFKIRALQSPSVSWHLSVILKMFNFFMDGSFCCWIFLLVRTEDCCSLLPTTVCSLHSFTADHDRVFIICNVLHLLVSIRKSKPLGMRSFTSGRMLWWRMTRRSTWTKRIQSLSLGECAAWRPWENGMSLVRSTVRTVLFTIINKDLIGSLMFLLPRLKLLNQYSAF